MSKARDLFQIALEDLEASWGLTPFERSIFSAPARTPLGEAGQTVLFEGTPWGERLTGGETNDLIFGFGGDDTINAGGSADVIDGGSGSDLIDGGSGNDVILGASGIDRIDGGSGDDAIDGGSENDFLNGGAGRDTINGGTDWDTIDGGDGNDILSGDDGNDYVFGSGGNDTITDTSGVDRLKGGIGDDTITVRGGDLGFDQVDGGSGSDTITMTRSKIIAHGNNDNDTFFTDLSRETFMIGDEGSDRFVITGAHPIGSGRIAEIHGGAAAVTTTSFLGIDSVATVTVGIDASVDTLDLSQLPSTVGTVNVNLAAGTMHDDQGVLLANMTGIEDVVGTSRADTITGNGVANDLRGGAGDDTISGGGGDDLLVGGAGRDTITGGSGRDRILGDHLTDAASRDTLTGGADSDTFVFVKLGQAQAISLLPSDPKQSVVDKITDFDTSGLDADKMDLSSLFDLHTSFNGTAQQALDARYIYFVQNGNSTTVMFDTNGGAHNDLANNFAIAEVVGVTPADLRADHFIV